MLVGSKDFESGKHYLVDIAEASWVIETFVLKCEGFDPSNNPNLVDVVSGRKHEVSYRYYYYECECSNDNLPPSTGRNLFIAHAIVNGIAMHEAWLQFFENKYGRQNVDVWSVNRQSLSTRFQGLPLTARARINQILDGSELEDNGRFNIAYSFDEQPTEATDDEKTRAMTNIIACHVPVASVVNVKIDKHGLLKEVLPIQNWSGYAPAPWYARNILATNNLSALVEKPINALGLKPGIYRLDVG
jgi:hypothetical protein